MSDRSYLSIDNFPRLASHSRTFQPSIERKMLLDLMNQEDENGLS